MFFARSNLGAVPVGKGGLTTTTIPPTAISGDVPLTGVDGTATADGKLIYVFGTWRVLSSTDVPAGTFPPYITAEYVRDVMKAPLFLGPFQIPWAAVGGTVDTTGFITSYVMPDPTKVSPELMKVTASLLKDWGDPHFSVTGYAAGDVMAVPSTIARNWPDCDGTTRSYKAWMAALGVGENRYYFNMLPTPPSSQDAKQLYSNALLGELANKFGYPIVPITTFTHPIGGQKWGVFTFLSSGDGPGSKSRWTGGYCPFSPQNGALGSDVGALQLRYWVGPTDAVKNYLVSTLQDSSTIAAIGSFLDSIWNSVIEIANWVGGLAGQLACSLQSAVCRAAKDPTTAAACLASIVVCSKGAGVPTTPPKPPTPWWLQWYVIVPAVGFVGYLLFKKSGSRSTAPST